MSINTQGLGKAYRRSFWTVFAICAMVIPAVGLGVQSGMNTTFDGLSETEARLLEGIDVENAMELAHFVSQGREKVTGTQIDHDTAELLSGKFESMGLQNVRLEEFPVDVWEHTSSDGAGYAVDGFTILSPADAPVKELESTIYSGCPGTGPEGLEGVLVDVGLGTNEEMAAAGDVTGKILLMKRDDNIWGWNSQQAFQAEFWGAAAVVNYGCMGRYPDDDAIKQDSLGGNNLPVFSVSENDAGYLLNLLTNGEVVVRLHAEVDIYRSVAYNVVGEIPGIGHPDEYIILQAHYDNWWVSYNDDCTGIGAMIDMVQNLLANYGNDRTIIVIATSAEEAGGIDGTWFNWCIGADNFVNDHAELRDKLVAVINLDVISPELQFWFDATPELRAVCNDVVSILGLDGIVHPYMQDSWQDSWVYAQLGYPAVHLWSWGMFYDSIYHTNLDTDIYCIPRAIEITEQVYSLLLCRLDSAGVLPMVFDETCSVLDSNIATLERVGTKLSSPIDFTAVQAALGRFVEAKDALAAALAEPIEIEPATADAINSHLLAATREVNSVLYELGGDSLWDVWYRGTEYVEAAVLMESVVQALEKGQIDRAANQLGKYTTLSWGKLMLPEAYDAMFATLTTNLGWGEPCAIEVVNVYDVWASLADKADSTQKQSVVAELEQAREWYDWAVGMANGDMLTLADGLDGGAIELESAIGLLVE